MRKSIKITALTGKNETIFVENNGDVYSVKNNSAEFVLNVKDFNNSKNALAAAITRLNRQGYKLALDFSKAAYIAFKEARKNHLKEKFALRDFVENSCFNY